MASVPWDEEWELWNDDGFVYKRKKRRVDSSMEAAISQAAPPDPEVEQKQRRDRKKKTLMKLRDQYKREIDQWEHLSNTLQALEERTHNYQQERRRLEPDLPPAKVSETVRRTLIDELLLQVEAQEAIINGVLNLCEVGEAVCETKEEQLKQPFIDLPVWDSPRSLMASLSDD